MENNDSSHPMVTVLMPVHNGQQYLAAAVASVLGQTYHDFELLIINDGSDDQSVEIIESFKDRKIRLLHNKQTLGVATSLNRGIKAARGFYLARMDCDDLCVPTRLEKLVDFMEARPEIGICGSFVRTVGGGDHTWKLPCDDRRIRCRLLFESCIPHPSAIMRLETIKRCQLLYDANYERAEDYHFWVRCSEHMQLANYPEALLQYRIHENQIGSVYSGPQRDAADMVRRQLLDRLGVCATEEMFSIHRALSTGRFDKDPKFLAQARDWLTTLLAANNETSYFPEPEFSQELAARLYRACYASAAGLHAWTIYDKSLFSRRPATSRVSSLKLFLRCIF